MSCAISLPRLVSASPVIQVAVGGWQAGCNVSGRRGMNMEGACDIGVQQVYVAADDNARGDLARVDFFGRRAVFDISRTGLLNHV